MTLHGACCMLRAVCRCRMQHGHAVCPRSRPRVPAAAGSSPCWRWPLSSSAKECGVANAALRPLHCRGLRCAALRCNALRCNALRCRMLHPLHPSCCTLHPDCCICRMRRLRGGAGCVACCIGMFNVATLCCAAHCSLRRFRTLLQLSQLERGRRRRARAQRVDDLARAFERVCCSGASAERTWPAIHAATRRRGSRNATPWKSPCNSAQCNCSPRHIMDSMKRRRTAYTEAPATCNAQNARCNKPTAHNMRRVDPS